VIGRLRIFARTRKPTVKTIVASMAIRRLVNSRARKKKIRGENSSAMNFNRRKVEHSRPKGCPFSYRHATNRPSHRCGPEKTETSLSVSSSSMADKRPGAGCALVLLLKTSINSKIGVFASSLLRKTTPYGLPDARDVPALTRACH
jgi:hypothetical protein